MTHSHFGAALALALTLAAPAAGSAAGRIPHDTGKFNIYAGGVKTATESFAIYQDEADSLHLQAVVEVHTPGDTIGIVNANFVKLQPELVLDAATGTLRRYHMLGLAHGTLEDVVVVPEPTGVHESGQTMDITAPEKPSPIDHHAPFDSVQGVLFDIRTLVMLYPLLARYDLDAGGVQTFPTYSPSTGNNPDAQITDNGLLPVRMPNGEYAARHYFLRVGRDPLNVWVDDSLRIVRVTLPAQGLEALRDNYYGTAWTLPGLESGLKVSDLTIPSAGAVLSGTVVRPDTNVALPGVILAGGLGHRTRDWALTGSPLVQDGAKAFAAMLARRGFVTLRYDGRGVGRSTGDRAAVTMEDRVADLQAAARALAKVKGVDKKRIAVVAPDIASWAVAMAPTKDVQWAAAVLLGPPGDPIDSLMMERVEITPMLPDDAAEAREQVQRLSELIAGTDLWAQWGGDSLYLPAYRQLVARRTVDVLAGLTCPTSIVICGQDRDVPPGSTQKLVFALKDRKMSNVDVAEFPLIDHYLMQTLPDAGLAELTDASRRVDDDVAGQIADWLTSKVAPPARGK